MSTSVTRRLGALDCIKSLAITGGTHGNEICGVNVVEHLMDNTSSILQTQRKSIKLTCLKSNHKAIELSRRYADKDLNRCFFVKDLVAEKKEDDEEQYEVSRARELDALLGPKASDTPHTDFIIDLHNTTANTGVLLCFHPQDALAAQVAAALQDKDSSIKTCYWSPDESGDVPFLPSVARSGLTLEVGAVAHSTASAPVMAQMLTTVKQIVNYLELRNEAIAAKIDVAADAVTVDADADEANQAKRSKISKQKSVMLTVAKRSGYVDFPRNSQGDINGFIHADLQGIQELATESRLVEGQALFVAGDGKTVMKSFVADKFGLTCEDVEAGVFPLFVNEAAYYEKGIAMMLTRVEQVGPYEVYVED